MGMRVKAARNSVSQLPAIQSLLSRYCVTAVAGQGKAGLPDALAKRLLLNDQAEELPKA